MVCFLTSSALAFTLGLRVRVVGKQAPRAEAPVVVCAPHTSFLDTLVVFLCRGSVVARIEDSRTPFVSSVSLITQTIFVERRSEASRRAAGEAMVARATSALPWARVFVFPEGTTTNGRALARSAHTSKAWASLVSTNRFVPLA